MASSSNRTYETPAAGDARRRAFDGSIVGITGALLGALVSVLGAFVVLRPNRVLPGVAERALAAPGGRGWWLLAGWLLLAALAVGGVLAARPRARALARIGPYLAFARGLGASAIAAAALWAAGGRAASFAALTGPLARTSLGASFWLMLAAAYLVLFSARNALPSRAARATVLLAFPLAALGLLASGALAELAVLREYAIAREAFWQAFSQHLAFTAGATGIAIVLGIGLGVWSARRSLAESAIFGVLNVAQVMPVLAFIGLLIPPMSWLGDNVPAAHAIGIGGIGWAPVFLVLVSYALYPITRNTHTAIRTLDAGIVDAARGMGMSARQRLLQVELPLAFPVVLAGVRIALVQTTAGSIIAALVGGGGLGRIVFYGLEQTAQDLVLLGVAPIVMLALTFDATLRAVGSMFAADISSATDAGEGTIA